MKSHAAHRAAEPGAECGARLTPPAPRPPPVKGGGERRSGKSRQLKKPPSIKAVVFFCEWKEKRQVLRVAVWRVSIMFMTDFNASGGSSSNIFAFLMVLRLTSCLIFIGRRPIS